MLCVSIGYLGVAVACLWNYRWAWWISILAMAAPIVMVLPMVCVNTLMLVSGHELYKDSPGTFLVVIMLAVVFVAPSTLFYFFLALDRKKLITILKRQREKEASKPLTSVSEFEDSSNPHRPPYSK